MTTGLVILPICSSATKTVLLSCSKAPLTVFNARTRICSYSSIASAMLGRAAKEYEAPNTKNDLAKQLFPSSSPAHDGNIQEQFKKVRQATQSVGGFTSFTNSTSMLGARSPDIKQGLKRKSESFTAPATSRLASVLNKQGSFQEPPSRVVDLTEENSFVSKDLGGAYHGVQFDEHDFEDDADLDLDIDYELPRPSTPPLKTHTSVSASHASHNSPPLPHLISRPQSLQHPPSSAPTWSSSSPSHLAPPRASLAQQRGGQVGAMGAALPVGSLDLNPRPAKKRTLPWSHARAEEDEISARGREKSLSRAPTDKREDPRTQGGYQKAERIKSIQTPRPHEKQMPWNSTASAMKEQKNAFRDKQKATKTSENVVSDIIQQHQNKKKATITPISLSEEQRRVLDLVVNKNKSVFFTGSAGTGKSVLMRSIIAELRRKHMASPERVAVTASTGLAACNIGGVTLHSYGGIGLGKEDVPSLVKKIKRNPKAKNRWLKTKVLIVDEISMVDGDLFDKLEGIARVIRNNGRPFGGIQLVITGDFFQLPPVPDYDNKARDPKFAFEAGTWSSAIHHTIGLTEVFRQKDPVFANMLNEMRLGIITGDTIRAFQKLSRKIHYDDSLEATELFPTRNEVENSNAFRMRDLHGQARRFEAVDTGAITDVNMREKLLSNMMAPKVIELKKGAQVMLIKNMDDGLVNGSLGQVVAFMSQTTFDIYEKNPDVFDEGVPTEDLDDRQREARQAVRKFSRDQPGSGVPDTGKLFPLVRFSIADGTSRELLVQPEEWKVELPNGEVQAQRQQLPLILAWALSIHKAQGQTLERVKIDLRRVFEKGQAYVALSRATCQAGLEVHNFDKSKVMAHPRVTAFYTSLYSVNKALEHPKISKAIPVKRKDRALDDDEDAEAAMAAAYGG